MVAYRLYFTDRSDRISSPPVEAAYVTIDEAVAAARRALERSAFSFVEVWCGAQMLARVAQAQLSA